MIARMGCVSLTHATRSSKTRSHKNIALTLGSVTGFSFKSRVSLVVGSMRWPMPDTGNPIPKTFIFVLMNDESQAWPISEVNMLIRNNDWRMLILTCGVKGGVVERITSNTRKSRQSIRVQYRYNWNISLPGDGRSRRTQLINRLYELHTVSEGVRVELYQGVVAVCGVLAEEDN